jgi:hypothetical protein
MYIGHTWGGWGGGGSIDIALIPIDASFIGVVLIVFLKI